jgi:phosphoribosylamine-glycine ligase
MISEHLRILLLGSGGREYAIAWKLSYSSRVEAIYVFPGNGGTESLPKTRNVTCIDAYNYRGLVQFALLERINLVAPSTEKPLADGIKELFEPGEKIHILSLM